MLFTIDLFNNFQSSVMPAMMVKMHLVSLFLINTCEH